MSERTFKITTPHMKGDDVKTWQSKVQELFAAMDIRCPIVADGDFGLSTRSFTASLCHAYGFNAGWLMAEGVTPALRTKIRNRVVTDHEAAEFDHRVDYRRQLRKRWGSVNVPKVALPVRHILEHSWGYHPGIHDGLDIITEADPVIFAVVHARVIDARDEGWWGLGAPSNPQLKAKGDGIIQLEILDDVGPFKKGMHIGYGHAEKAVVNVGDIVNAGDPIGHAGLANAWHIHWMINDGSTTRGIGNRNPEPFLEYCINNS